MIDLSYGIKLWAEGSFVLSQCTEGQTDRWRDLDRIHSHTVKTACAYLCGSSAEYDLTESEHLPGLCLRSLTETAYYTAYDTIRLH